MEREYTDDPPQAGGIPMLGLGTWQNANHEQCVRSVRTALEVGYRHLDTARAYGNEAAVGEGIARAIDDGVVERGDVFLATKVWCDSLANDDVIESARASLDSLGVDYVDLLYVHWPARTYDPEDTLPAFEALSDRGLIEHVGVSNFEPRHLEAATAVLDGSPLANQVEMHPLLRQDDLRAYCADAGIELVAYSPLARGKVVDVPELVAIAEKHDASPAQVALAWLRHAGVAAIPKATGEAHIRENWDSLAIDLDDDDLAEIESIDREDRRIHPTFGPDEW